MIVVVRTLSLLMLMAGCGRLGFGATQSEPDAGVDAAEVSDPCDPRVNDDTVALYAFDASLVGDSTTLHDAINRGATPSTAPRCGSGAAQFANGGYLRVADSPAFDLPVGSVELFVRTPDPSVGDLQGILSRDAVGTDFDGHFLIAFAASGQLFARIQHTPATHVFRCTVAPVSEGTWHHVGISFGAPGFRMWVDGALVTGTSLVYDNATVSCEAPHAFGIDGNDNALIIGALNYLAADNAPEPTVAAPLTGEVDQIRIRDVWRDFTE
jgi:Concanavalin A-like lectin/glucanases superfamily